LIAVISDIHANYEALSAVLEQIDRLGPEMIICLGDIVGYGPDPVRCIDAVRQCCQVVLCGNHDDALVRGAGGFNSLARASLEWHRRLVMPRPDSTKPQAERLQRWEFLKRLRFRYARGRMLFVHASPRNPLGEYLRRLDVLLGMGEKFRANFEEIDWLCFGGHTHKAGVITEDLKFIKPEELDGVFRPDPQKKALVNVGSVGQPRDGDWRACFVTVEDDGTVRYHRVEYDVEATVAKMASAPGLNHALDGRLRLGR